ncbi:MAG: YraN family protein [Bacteroidia bacterium]|nr:YraN family protein [Bacteroidia bacterium]
MAENHELGRKGEEMALEHLKKNGYEILATNWQFKHLELDIVAQKDKTLVIVEVKTRSSDYFEQPADTVNRKKQKLIIEATNGYIEQFDLDMEVRFDIISIYFYGKRVKLEHIEDAFYPLINR